MLFKSRLLLLVVAILLIGIGILVLEPFIAPSGIRLWLQWQASRQGLNITLDKISAPLLRPIEVRGIHIISLEDCPFQIDLVIPRAEFDLDVRVLLGSSRHRPLHRLSLHDFNGSLRHKPKSKPAACHFDWGTFHRLLSDDINISNANLRIENGAMRIELHAVDLSASELSAGRILAREVQVDAPFFHREFHNLRGATSWEIDRLTIGALEIARGIDLESVTADFANLKRRQIGVEMNLDAFGGKLRASVSVANHKDRNLWSVAGSGSEISLAQMSNAAQLAINARGLVRASKFTFRGDPRDISHATASIWLEVANLTWRDRTAETIMLGASLSNRQIQIEQLYVKQLRNQLTLTGEYLVPLKLSDWLNPDFRGDLSASINDLGDFARLFGGGADDFAGVLSVHGTVKEKDRRIAGQLFIKGNSLRAFRAPIDLFSAEWRSRGSQLEMTKFEATRGKDFLRGNGQLGLSRGHNYSGTLTGFAGDIADYAATLPQSWQQLNPRGAVSFTWNGHGNFSTHSGDFQLHTQHLRIATDFNLAPFDAAVEGGYSPQNAFFRQFQLSNDHAALSAFVTLARNYVQLQTLRFDLNGKPKLQGDVFLPLDLTDFLRSGKFLASVDLNQEFNVNLALDSTDLAEFSSAISGQPMFSGTLGAYLEVYGAVGALQLGSKVSFRELAVAGDKARLSAELGLRSEGNILTLQGRAVASASDALTFDAALPLRPKSKQTPNLGLFATDKPVSASVNFPLILVAKLPRYLRRDNFASGIFSGKLRLTNTLKTPELNGDAHLIDGRFQIYPLHPLTASGRLAFNGSTAKLEFANLQAGEGAVRLRGEIDFADLDDVSVHLRPSVPLTSLSHSPNTDCINGVTFVSIGRGDQDRKPLETRMNTFSELFPTVSEIALRGRIPAGPWRLILTERDRDEFFDSERDIETAFHLCDGGNVLEFGLPTASKFDIGHDAIRKFQNGRVR